MFYNKCMGKTKQKYPRVDYQPRPMVFGDYTYSLTGFENDKRCILHSYIGHIDVGGDFEIPLEINGYQVCSFTDHFCFTLNGINRLIFPDGFMPLGDAFELGQDLSSLYTVTEIIVRNNENLTDIDGVLFWGHSLIKYPPLKEGETYIIPSGTDYIAPGAFYGARYLKSIVIPNTVEEIMENAFTNCFNLSSIIIPESVTCLGDSLFTGCLSLKTVVIESSMPNLLIGASLFFGCTSLQTVIINQDNPDYCVIDGIVYAKPGCFSWGDKKHTRDEYRLVYYPTAKKGDNYVIPSFVGYIAEFAFVDNPYLKTIQAYSLPIFNDMAFKGSRLDKSQVDIISLESSSAVEASNSAFLSNNNGIKNTNATNDKSSEDLSELKYIYPDVIITVADKFICIGNGHHLKDKRIKIRMVDLDNHLIDIPIEVGYCIECGRYYIYSDFYRKEVEPLYREGWKIIGTQFQLPDMKIIGYKVRRNNGTMATESILKLCGYTVGYNSPLTAKDRHSILQGIIDKGLLGRQEIMSYLNHFIEFNGKSPSKDMTKAIDDWEEDLHNL